MHTTLILVALLGVSSTAGEELIWRTSYGQAKKEGASERKPLAVVVGTGAEGWEKIAQEGALSNECRTILAASYVCVYVDRTTEEGRRLAAAFEIPEGTGIVISNVTGELQAFRHAGTLEATDLSRYLRKYADPERVAITTETHTTQRTSFYPSRTGTGQPVPYWQGGFAPFGGCPNCR
jgi:hypothetical protein